MENEKELLGLLEVSAFKHYLHFAAENLRYSEDNLQRLLKQFPTATKVLTFEEWQKLDVLPKKKSRALEVLVPRKIVKRDATHQLLTTADGERMIETRFVLSPCLFDVSQTNASKKEWVSLFNRPECLGTPLRYAKLFVGLRAFSAGKVAIDFLKSETLPDEKQVWIPQGLGEEVTIKRILRDLVALEVDTLDEGIRNFEVRAISYALFGHLKLSCEEETFPELALWTKEGKSPSFFEPPLSYLTALLQQIIRRLDPILEATFDPNVGKNPFERRLLAVQKTRRRGQAPPISEHSIVPTSPEPPENLVVQAMNRRMQAGNATRKARSQVMRKERKAENDE
ncbi:hypothetical protein GRR92_06030 [Lactococcus lactis subsp. lactis]|uniref:hypothetical protein n=1 Tax=Lactococcus lactis TaxID=1358 RepID=UPI0003BA182D|nr:hypothetical protein [Lactococcus lactis]AGY45523.1 hypothetical protein P620_06565 [Lactococcus lactis subsp. lactis KLDS 4.0325]MBR8673900.1 hypothetical protein [Lactococcus lactis subsp. lactis]MBR8676715.1 hypothetical protein [Lactococcus lactis subsp. lactis]MBR8684201.1 hypothetical protein [Lactococcus lactis subsp. lactis]